MPRFEIDAPDGAPRTAKRKMLADITAAMQRAYRIDDVRGWLSEFSGCNSSQGGQRPGELARPVCQIDAPELRDAEVKQHLVDAIGAAIAEAYEGVADSDHLVVLIREYPPGNQGLNQVHSISKQEAE